MKISMLILRILLIIVLVIIAVAGVIFLFSYDGPGGEIETNKSTEKTTDSTDKTKPVSAPLALYYVALNDNGKAGEAIGCEDSLVPMITESVTTTNRLKEAMTRLLANKMQKVDDTELYNVLYQADLELQNATVENGVAKVSLIGELNLRGVCDNPRVEAQLEETAKTAADVDKVEITLNDKPLSEALSLQ
jgi:hypothetical protein